MSLEVRIFLVWESLMWFDFLMAGFWPLIEATDELADF